MHIYKLNPPVIITFTNYTFILGGLNILFSISLAIFIICCIELMSEDNQTSKLRSFLNVILSPKSSKVYCVKVSRLLCAGEEVKFAMSITAYQFCRICRVHLQMHNRSFAHEHSHLGEETKKM